MRAHDLRRRDVRHPDIIPGALIIAPQHLVWMPSSGQRIAHQAGAEARRPGAVVGPGGQGHRAPDALHRDARAGDRAGVLHRRQYGARMPVWLRALVERRPARGAVAFPPMRKQNGVGGDYWRSPRTWAVTLVLSASKESRLSPKGRPWARSGRPPCHRQRPRPSPDARGHPFGRHHGAALEQGDAAGLTPFQRAHVVDAGEHDRCGVR